MRAAIAAMAEAGNNLIVDEVMCDGEIDEYRRLLSPFELFTVGVFAPLDILEAREIARGDRMPGLARWQFNRVHANMEYDFVVDTSLATPGECAAATKSRFRL